MGPGLRYCPLPEPSPWPGCVAFRPAGLSVRSTICVDGLAPPKAPAPASFLGAVGLGWAWAGDRGGVWSKSEKPMPCGCEPVLAACCELPKFPGVPPTPDLRWRALQMCNTEHRVVYRSTSVSYGGPEALTILPGSNTAPPPKPTTAERKGLESLLLPPPSTRCQSLTCH